MNVDTEWTWADAWVLAAVTADKAGSSLCDLIATADAINHAIPTRAELSSSLGALLGAGLVESLPGARFRTSAHGAAITRRWRGGLFGWRESLLPGLHGIPRPAAAYPLTEAQVDSAYQEYVRRVRHRR